MTPRVRRSLGNDTAQHVEVLGRGVGGNRVPDLLKRLDRDVLYLRPSLVVVYIGINDVWHFSLNGNGTSRKEYKQGLGELIQRILASGSRVLLCTPTVIGEKDDGMNPQDSLLNQYANVSRSVARELEINLCDLHETFRAYLSSHNPDNRGSGILTRDGVHLSEAGNSLVAKAIIGCLKNMNPSQKPR